VRGEITVLRHIRPLSLVIRRSVKDKALKVNRTENKIPRPA
jgi:hypothetical protein